MAGGLPSPQDGRLRRDRSAGRCAADSFTAKLTHFEPTVLIADDGQVTGARLAFHFRDLVTGKDKRDTAMHKWQQTDQFPDGQFVLSSLDAASPPATGFIAQGRLTLHGVARDVKFPVSVLREGER